MCKKKTPYEFFLKRMLNYYFFLYKIVFCMIEVQSVIVVVFIAEKLDLITEDLKVMTSFVK